MLSRAPLWRPEIVARETTWVVYRGDGPNPRYRCRASNHPCVSYRVEAVMKGKHRQPETWCTELISYRLEVYISPAIEEEI